MPEPTILDYFKAKLTFWRPTDLRIPDLESPESDGLTDASSTDQNVTNPGEHGLPIQVGTVEQVKTEFVQPALQDVEVSRPFPWRASLSLVSALLAQRALDPPSRSVTQGVILYGLSAFFLVLGGLAGEWKLPTIQPIEHRLQVSWNRWPVFLARFLLAVLTFLLFGIHLFNPLTVAVWLLTLGAFIYSFFAPEPFPWAFGWRTFIKARRVSIHITPWTVLVLLALVLVVWFRVYRINEVPAEMISDHAEKLLDVWDVLNGQTSVFFPRNTGREFFQFYLTAAVINILRTGYTFLSLKIGTILMGILTLPYIYLIGKELGNRRVGLYALLFAGIAFWPNIISRFALRFVLYPAFAAPTLYFLLRGLRTSRRNYFIYAGIALGLGLNGYTPFRIMPFVVIAAVGLYLLHRQSRGTRIQAIYGVAVLAAVAFVLFIPLLRYAVDNPDMFVYRSLTRLGSLEAPLPGPAWQIFLSNLWNALTMFFWSDGEVWVHSIPYRPALDQVSAALFFLGAGLILVRYLQKRNWTDAFLLVSIPLLMMPSILSLAFPRENPSLNRTGAAMIPVFVLLGIGLDAFLTGLRDRLPRTAGRWTSWAIGLVLLTWSVTQNYDLVFRQYDTLFRSSAWNTSEIGRVVRGFADSIGTADTAWVVPYPYWVDTRLVGINAGFATKDYAISIEQIPETISISGAKLFILNRDDTKGLKAVHDAYPDGSLSLYKSSVPGKDFFEYFVSTSPD